MCPRIWSFSILSSLVLLLLAPRVDAQNMSRSEATRTFAKLLKIPTEAPPASVITHGVKEDGGLLIEDISWDSLDGERPPAYVVRPTGSEKSLPAIVCLHGSSGSRDSMVTMDFG